MLGYILLILVIISLIFFYVKKNEKTETFIEFSGDAIDSVTRKEVEEIVDLILQDINKTYNKNITRGVIDRVERTLEENGINYNINVFIYNNDRYTNKKINFDVTVNDNTIILNNIKMGNSRNILIEERGGIPGRESISYKPFINIYNVLKNEDNSLEYSDVNYDETEEKMTDRTSWVLDTDAVKNKDNIKDITKDVYHIWDCYGVEKTDNKGKILNHGTKKINSVPNFHPSNFTDKKDSYNWLFDPSQDSASRPVGVTGATGSS